MKQRFWLLRRGDVYYLQDSFSGKRESLQIKDPQTAAKIRDARIEVNQRPELSLALGRAYLKVHDPDMAKRTWADVMEEQAKRGADTTQERCRREIKTKPFDLIRNKPLVETTAGDLLAVIRSGNNSTNGFLRIFHHLAFGLGWIYRPILPSKLWPRTHQSTVKDKHRSAEFYRRCKVLKIVGISLHSYRYAWAQRAKSAGYPQRWAEEALGHNSPAVHEAYAKGATVICPPLKDFEERSTQSH